MLNRKINPADLTKYMPLPFKLSMRNWNFSLQYFFLLALSVSLSVSHTLSRMRCEQLSSSAANNIRWSCVVVRVETFRVLGLLHAEHCQKQVVITRRK